MHLAIHTLEKTLFEGEAEKIIAQTPNGEITVLDGHLPLISILNGPELKVVDKQNNINRVSIASGFLEIRPANHIVVLAN